VFNNMSSINMREDREERKRQIRVVVVRSSLFAMTSQKQKREKNPTSLVV